MKLKANPFPSYLSELNPAADTVFRNFWATANTAIQAAPLTSTVTWVSKAQVGRYLQPVKRGLKPSDDEWRHRLRVLVLDHRKHSLHLEHFFITNQMKFAAALSGVLYGLSDGNYLVACSMLRSGIEIVASTNQFIEKHLKVIPATFDSAEAETKYFFDFHEPLVKALFPTRYNFDRFDDQGQLRPVEVASTKSSPWVYEPKEGTVDRRASSIMGAIDLLDKKLLGAREMYERICEFVHPNVGSSILLSHHEQLLDDVHGVQRFHKALHREFAGVPVATQIILPDMLNFGTMAITMFDALLSGSIAQRDAYHKMGQGVSRRILMKYRKYFEPYSECPCESKVKFRFCCGSD